MSYYYYLPEGAGMGHGEVADEAEPCMDAEREAVCLRSGQCL